MTTVRHKGRYENDGGCQPRIIFINLSIETKRNRTRYVDLDILPLQTRGEALSQFLGLLLVVDDERVQEAGATDLELRLVGPLAYLHEARVLAAGLLEEIANVGDLLWHDEESGKVDSAVFVSV